MIPWWVWIYLVTYLVFATWAFGYELDIDTEPVWYLVIQGVTDSLLLAAGFAYWSSQLHLQLASMLLPLFTVGVVILCWQIVVTLRRRPPSTRQRSLPAILFCGRSGAALWSIVSAPLAYWGFRAAILGEHLTG